MSGRVLVLALIAPTVLVAGHSPTSTAQEPGGKPRLVKKTDAEWKELLTPQQYMVTRRKATEPAFSGKYATTHAKGTFACVCCGAPLFSSQTKFDSGTGWPSFWRPIDPKRVDTAPDFELGEARVEVLCNDCGSHLGHVFNDGPPPTGLRYCINSLSLKLVPAAATATKKGVASKAKKGRTPSAPDTSGQDPTSGAAQADDSKPAETKDKAPTGK